MRPEISHYHSLIGPRPLRLLHRSFKHHPQSPFLYERAMSTSPHHEPAQQQRGGSVVAALEEEKEEKARCEWDFRLSTVVSPSTAAGEVSDAIGAIEFDPTDRLLATGGIARKIRIYSLGTLIPESRDSSLTFSDHSTACLLCICTPAKLSSLRWRPDSSGRTVGSGDYDGVVMEYDVERNVAVFERDEHAGRRVWSVDYSVSGDLGASGSDDGTVQLWDSRCANGGLVAAARAGGAVCSVEFDPEGGPWVGAGSADRHAYVFDVRAVSAGPVAALGGHGRAVTYVRFAQSGRSVVTSGTDGSHRLWEWAEGREVRAYRGHVNSRSFVGMSVWRGAGLVGSGSESNEVFVYDLRWKEPIWVREFGPRREEGGAFVGAVSWRQAVSGPGEGALVAGGSDGVLQVFVGRKKTESE
ncbi:WD repeat-containing protein RUP2-like [Musa acuminata AAA Group]|uniref:WD repeat-containing protein RUP2-like n=1 Tax=Musa acuminata AAA Group TaxID=214697 RepID=UPI0031DFB540